MALAAFRTYRLVALDDITQPLRDRAVGVRYGGGVPVFERPLLAKWVACVYCSGLWYSAGWYAAWVVWPRATAYAAVPFALSAVVAIVQTLLPE